ncbi:hypothetical protein WJX84_008181 [Apatococcus fuscideae]|uniref:SAM-dependent MTase RsmB/NOP-type domain-containing protein n=1 Tax=Apatococcus fuscideae TaxID=2026836 RepID=A0AAW1SSL5_9CHLO
MQATSCQQHVCPRLNNRSPASISLISSPARTQKAAVSRRLHSAQQQLGCLICSKKRRESCLLPRRCIKLGSSKQPIEEVTEEAGQKWGVFQWREYNRPWQVPWGGLTVAAGMVGWAVSFLGVALVLLPAVGSLVGVKDFTSMSATDKSVYALANQILETFAGLGIVFLATRKFMPLSPDILKFDIREPFAKPRGWLAWGLLGVLLSPLVVGAAAAAFSLLGYDEVNGKGTVDGVAQILSLDLPSFASLFGVTAVLAPILEETVFRGFLLTSLTKFMPTWAAVIASSVAFGLAHLSVRDLPQLVVLGTLLGFVYVPNARAFWTCSSVVDRQAAHALEKILEAHTTRRHGVSLKSLTLGSNIEAKKATYAVTLESLKHLQVIDAILERSQLLQDCSQLTRSSAVVLVYELLFGQGMRPLGPAERHVQKHKDCLEAALFAELQDRGVQNVSEILPETEESRPRSVRVNTIKLTVAAATSRLQADVGSVEPDDLLGDVLILPSSCHLHDHPWVKNGNLILQSKASCMPAQALQPKPGWTVMDCCAAPGNKTTHVAAMLDNKGEVIAVDRDPQRFKRLKANAELAGATCIRCIQDDFLKLDLEGAEFSSVDGVLLDPSCSGSGTTHTQLDRLLSPSGAGRQAERECNFCQQASHRT